MTRDTVCPRTTSILFIAGSCNPIYILPINLKTNVAPIIAMEAISTPLISCTMQGSTFISLLQSTNINITDNNKTRGTITSISIMNVVLTCRRAISRLPVAIASANLLRSPLPNPTSIASMPTKIEFIVSHIPYSYFVRH